MYLEVRGDVPGGAPATAGRGECGATQGDGGVRRSKRAPKVRRFSVRRRGAGLPNFCGAPTVSCETNRCLTRCGMPNVRLRRVRRRTKQALGTLVRFGTFGQGNRSSTIF
jgi:hypothetical protein